MRLGMVNFAQQYLKSFLEKLGGMWAATESADFE
jgi:hypothetical protein